jgi:hypothetical protein
LSAGKILLSVKSWDMQATHNRADHAAMLTGSFTCAALPGSPFMVQRGKFELFNVDQHAPGTKNLTYDFDMASVSGGEYHFHGYKVVDSSCALEPVRLWTAAARLYVTNSKNEKVQGRGMMHTQPSDFLSEVFTLQPSGRTLSARISGLLDGQGGV